MTKLMTSIVLSFHMNCRLENGSTCFSVSDLSFSLELVLRDSGTKNMMKTTSARATREAVMITHVSLPVNSSIPAPRAGDMMRDAANPAVTSP